MMHTAVVRGKPYPRQVFTVLIWGSARARFGDPENLYRGKAVCVSGKVRLYRGVPEIAAYNPSQITPDAGRRR